MSNEVLENKYERVGKGNSKRSGAARSRLKLKMANRKTEGWGKGKKAGNTKKGSNGSNGGGGSSVAGEAAVTILTP